MSGQYDRIIQPGQSGKIPIRVSTGHGTGPINKGVSVVTNVTGANSTINLQVKGELWQVIQATPNSALFGNVSAAQTKEGLVVRKLTIANNGETPVKLGEIKSGNPAFKGEMKDLEAGKKWELTITLASPQPPGVQSGMVEFDTGVAELPKLQIACSAYLVADVDVVPNKMMLPGTRTVNLQRDFYIRNNASKPLHISELAASNPMMKVGLQETQTGMAFRISMDVPPEYKIPKDGDKITFKTDNSSYPTMTIPITEAPPAPPVPTAAAPGMGAPAKTAGADPKVPGITPIVRGKLNPAAKDQAGTTPPQPAPRKPGALPPGQPGASPAAANSATPAPQQALKPVGK